MSKELNLVDTLVTETPAVATQPEMIKLSELSLALVGGGCGVVAF